MNWKLKIINFVKWVLIFKDEQFPTSEVVNIEPKTLMPITIKNEKQIHSRNLSNPDYRGQCFRDMAAEIGVNMYENKLIEIRVEERAEIEFLSHGGDVHKTTFLAKVIPPLK